MGKKQAKKNGKANSRPLLTAMEHLYRANSLAMAIGPREIGELKDGDAGWVLTVISDEIEAALTAIENGNVEF